MQREKNIKVKEVIASLCKLLAGLNVESVPTADAFRRAKFNRKNAAIDMWRLLNSVLQRAFALDCVCQDSKDQDYDTQLMFVRSSLWHCGYGAPWVVGLQLHNHIEQVGSRDLLLAFGWVLSSVRLLEFLLAEKVYQLDILSSAPRVTQGLMCGLEDIMAHATGDHATETVMKDESLQALRWQHGKLRLQWKSLLSAQEERSTFTHKVISNISPSTTSQTRVTGSHNSKTMSTGLDKDLECVQTLNEILEAYLDWKLHEPLFWCWMTEALPKVTLPSFELSITVMHWRMEVLILPDESSRSGWHLSKDSVIDSSLADACEVRLGDRPPGEQAVTLRCPHGDKARRSVRRLDRMLLRLQTELRVRRIEQSTLMLTSKGRRQEAFQLSDRQRMEVEKKVASCLEGLCHANTPTITSRGFLPCFQDPHPVKASHKPQTRDLTLPVKTGKLQASLALSELRNQEAVLQWQLEQLRQSVRMEMQRQVNTMKGLVLIPPIKK